MIKKIITFLCFLIFCCGFSGQTYQFDFLTKYHVKNFENKYEGDMVNYFNSDDESYFLKITGNGQALTATLFDKKNSKIHFFYVHQEKKGNEVFFSFKHTSTIRNFHLDDEFKREIFSFSEIDSGKTILTIYKSKKSANPHQTYKLSLKKANKNLFPLSRMSLMHPYNFAENLTVQGNFIVDKAEYESGKMKCEFSLSEYKNVELELTVK